MINNTSKVVELVVNNDLCIGCGLCTYKCPNDALKMDWNDNGLLVAIQTSNCDCDGSCITVCPFNPFPKEITKTEDEISNMFFAEPILQNNKIGKYLGVYAGYSKEFRLTSSSGGIGTYVLTELLDRGIVDYVFSVKEGSDSGSHYEYSISNNREELLNGSKTRYFPVTLSDVFSRVDKIDGKVAIVGVACFVKGVRLAQVSDSSLRDKIPFIVGIICGGIKSKFFTEYLSDAAGVKIDNISKPDYRLKDINSSAGDYSFGSTSLEDNKVRTIKMSKVGDMWGTGLFKANACDFCDDVTTELADISLGDAWLSPYIRDGKGTNVVVTRSSIAEIIIQDGFKRGELSIENLSLEKFISSQQGSFNHRQKGLSYRIKKAKKEKKLIPPKRHETPLFLSINFRMVQYYRMKVRSMSFDTWKKYKNANDFNTEMRASLLILKKLTKFNHYIRTIFTGNLLSAVKRKLKKKQIKLNI